MRRDGGFRPAHSRPGWLSCPQCYLANLDRFCPLSCMSCKLFATLHATSGREETGGAGTGVPCAARRDLGYESVCTLLLSPPLVSRYVVPIRFLELQPPGRAWHAPLPDALCHGCLLFFCFFFFCLLPAPNLPRLPSHPGSSSLSLLVLGTPLLCERTCSEWATPPAHVLILLLLCFPSTKQAVHARLTARREAPCYQMLHYPSLPFVSLHLSQTESGVVNCFLRRFFAPSV